MNKNFVAAVVILVGITGIITFATTCTYYVCEVLDHGQVAVDATEEYAYTLDATPENRATWSTYTSDVQGFSFKYPLGYMVTESKHWEHDHMRTIHIVRVDKDGNPVPPVSMVMNVWTEAGILETSLWESIPFEWYEDVLGTFSFNSGLTS